jgi:hypothetical protein
MNEADDGHGPLLLSLHSNLIFMTVVMIATTTCHHYPGRGWSAAKVMPGSLVRNLWILGIPTHTNNAGSREVGDG